jgi:hypothetical protein
MSQLPLDIQTRVYIDFLFEPFVTNFAWKGNFFKLEKKHNINGEMVVKKGQPFYSFEDQIFRDFMMGVMMMLEPRTEPRDTIIYRSIEVVDEMFFIMKGNIDIGFEISRNARYCIRLDKMNVIGVWNITFDKKTNFIYRVYDRLEAFTVRKIPWRHHLENPDFSSIA